MEMRDLLYFNPARAPALFLPEIRAAGWNVHVESDIRKVSELINERNFLIGLAHFETLNDHSVHFQIENLFPIGSHIEWVALLSRTCTQLTQSYGLIMKHFYDYHTLPPDPQRLLITLGHAYGMANMLRMLFEPRDGNIGEYEMVGTSPVMQSLFRDIRKVAQVDAPVLISGESGTGKELTARAIHQQSSRSQSPFIAVNCGALPPGLIQSELFGYEKGAFTGAHQRKVGFIERANGGTIFLDEIGDLSLELQTNLLRFLEEKTIHRIGGSSEIPLDVRVISATHIDLEGAIKEGRFREDLYYRLNVLRLRMPPLRERGQDIKLLAQFFFENFRKERIGQVRGFSHQALRAMSCYHWPGNVRELRNRVQSAVVMCENRLITPADLGLEGWMERTQVLSLREAKARIERETIERALCQMDNCIVETARALGVSHVTLYRLLKKHGIMVHR